MYIYIYIIILLYYIIIIYVYVCVRYQIPQSQKVSQYVSVKVFNRG